MLRIAIDGACRRNGQPDCVASGGVFIQHYSDEGNWFAAECLATHEYNSTNQRGELLALILALKYITEHECDSAQLITDSEYIFNAMTKVWYSNWAIKGWKTASGDPVKNCDLWLMIAELKLQCDRDRKDIIFYHIKGHVVPFGKVTAAKTLRMYPNGVELHVAACDKYDDVAKTSRKDAIEAAQQLSEKNNGFRLPDDVFKNFVAMNTVVDAVATFEVEMADNNYKVFQS